MKRALVVVTPSTRSKQLVESAGAFAAGSGGELVLLSITPPEDYEHTHAAVEDIGSSDLVYTLDQAEESAARRVKRLAREALEDYDVGYEIIATIGREADTVLDVAEDRECDHLFLTGRKRSPTGKALFGDLTQQILLSFDGPVTVLLGEEE